MDEVRSFLFGMVIASAIGPVAILIIQRGVNHGFKSALVAGLGAGMGDFVYGVSAFLLGTLIIDVLEGFHSWMKWGCGVVLLGIGGRLFIQSWRRFFRRVPMTSPQDIATSNLVRTFFGFLLLVLANPLTILIFIGFMGQLNHSMTTIRSIYFAFFIFCGSTLIQVLLAGSGVVFGRWMRDRKKQLICNILSSLGILFFGVLQFI